MKLLRLELKNYRGAPNGSWWFTQKATGAPLDTVFVTGPASSGKTSFLEAIAALKESVGAYDMPPLTKRLLRRGASRGRIEGVWKLSPEEMARSESQSDTISTALDLGSDEPSVLLDAPIRALFESYSHDPTQGKFEYFGANRSILGPEGRPLSVAEEGRLRLGKTYMKYTLIKRDLIRMALADGVTAIDDARARGLLLRVEQRDSLAPYREALAELVPHLRLVGVQAVGKTYDLFFERQDGSRLTLDELSDSEQQAFLFCATFLRIGLNHSVVLVDQPELQLHADMQLRVVKAIERLGIDNQIFLATGSLEILRPAADANVIRLDSASEA